MTEVLFQKAYPRTAYCVLSDKIPGTGRKVSCIPSSDQVAFITVGDLDGTQRAEEEQSIQ